MLNVELIVNEETFDCIRDLHCYPKRFNIGVAEAKTSQIDVPYRNGFLDVTEALAPVRYKARQIVIPMIIVHAQPLAMYDVISNLFSGKSCRIKVLSDLENNPTYYYEGRVQIGGLSTNKSAWEFDLTMTAYPYKMRKQQQTINAPDTVVLINEGIDTIPTIITSAFVSGEWNGAEFTLGAGTHVPPELMVIHGTNVVTIESTATVVVEYMEKRL